MHRRGLAVGLAIVVLLAAVVPVCAQLVTTRFSLTNAGLQANGGSWYPSIDTAGRFVAFHSWADNLGPVDRNFKFDVYVRDRIFGLNHLVSVSPGGAGGDQESIYPTISGDGRHVVFTSTAANLVLGPTNGVSQVYVTDWQLGLTERVSVSSTGEEANAPSAWPAVSSDGRYVVFQSSATNLIAGGNPNIGIYLRDRQLGTTECLSVRSDGALPGGGSYSPWISPDGRYVVFTTWGNLVAADTNTVRDVYLRDRLLGVTQLVSLPNTVGVVSDGDSGGLPRAICSPDGRYVVFSSLASNLVAGDTNGLPDVFLRDRVAGTTERISVSSSGEEGNDSSGLDSYALGMSADGRFVSFSSRASNLAPDDTNGRWDAFLRDRQAGTTTRLSVSSTTGEEGNNISAYYGISTNARGALTVFDSHANNLVPNDTNSCMDVFLYAPVTITGTATAIIDGDEPYTQQQEVTLSVAPFDATQLRFKNDDGAWSDWQAAATTVPWTLSAGDGIKRVYVQGRQADLTESPESYDEIVLDGTPPTEVSVVIDDGDATTASRDATLSLHALGAAEMRFHNETDPYSAWEPYADTKAWTLSFGDGAKRVYLQTRDAAHNESAETYDDITLDATPPNGVSITVNDDAAFTNSRDVTLTIHAPDAAEMRFRNEVGDWSSWQAVAPTAAWTLSDGDGLKRVYAQGRDALANESTETWDEITLDRAAPTDLGLTINEGAASTPQREVVLAVTGPDDAAEIRFRNEAGVWSEWQAFAENVSWLLSDGDGLKQVSVEARDLAGNVSTPVSASITLDTTAPTGLTISIDDGADFTLVRHVTLTLAAAGATQMRFRNEAGPWSEWEPLAVGKAWDLSSGRGLKTVGFQGRDGLGNVSEEATDSITWGGFTDVPTDFWDYSLIMACVDDGVVQGYRDGTYHPEFAVTRAQMAVYLARVLLGGEANVPAGPPTPSFSDVAPDSWAYRHTEYCKAENIVTGYPDGTYHPDWQVNRGQMAAFVGRAYAPFEQRPGLTGYTPPSAADFPDVAPDFAYYRYIEYCLANGIVTGYRDGTYHPEFIVNRGQMAAYVARAFGLTMD